MSKFTDELALVVLGIGLFLLVWGLEAKADPQPSKLDKLITKYYQQCKYNGILASDLGMNTGSVAWNEFCVRTAYSKAIIETNDSNIPSVEE